VFWETHLRGVFRFYGASESILFIYLNDTLNHYCKLYFFRSWEVRGSAS